MQQQQNTLLFICSLLGKLFETARSGLFTAGGEISPLPPTPPGTYLILMT
jgi:hypothetical protein